MHCPMQARPPACSAARRSEVARRGATPRHHHLNGQLLSYAMNKTAGKRGVPIVDPLSELIKMGNTINRPCIGSVGAAWPSLHAVGVYRLVGGQYKAAGGKRAAYAILGSEATGGSPKRVSTLS
jgi:hypothetical protein